MNSQNEASKNSEVVAMNETLQSEMQLIHELPGLSENATIALNDSGWDSRAYSVNNGQYFVKFPRNEKIQGRYSYQIAAQKLAGQIDSPVKIPKVVWEDPEYRYFGYEAIPGIPLTEAVETMDMATKQTVGAALGVFLKQFHQLDLPSARPMGPDHEIAQNQAWYQKGIHVSSPFFTKAEQQILHELVYVTWPAQLAKLDMVPALCHGDLHFNNIFYANGEIGVIDFGDTCNADHSKDLADFGDDIIFQSALAAYGNMDDNLVEKIRLREEMTRVITLTAQLLKGDMQAAKQTISKIKTILLSQ